MTTKQEQVEPVQQVEPVRSVLIPITNGEQAGDQTQFARYIKHVERVDKMIAAGFEDAANRVAVLAEHVDHATYLESVGKRDTIDAILKLDQAEMMANALVAPLAGKYANLNIARTMIPVLDAEGKDTGQTREVLSMTVGSGARRATTSATTSTAGPRTGAWDQVVKAIPLASDRRAAMYALAYKIAHAPDGGKSNPGQYWQGIAQKMANGKMPKNFDETVYFLAGTDALKTKQLRAALTAAPETFVTEYKAFVIGSGEKWEKDALV